jgi:hypothetical protein
LSFLEEFGFLLFSEPASFNGIDLHRIRVLPFLLFGCVQTSEAVLAGGDISSSSSWSNANCHIVVTTTFFSCGIKPFLHVLREVLVSADGTVHIDRQSITEEPDGPRGFESPLRLFRQFYEAVDVGIHVIVLQLQFLEGHKGVLFFCRVGELQGEFSYEPFPERRIIFGMCWRDVV